MTHPCQPITEIPEGFQHLTTTDMFRFLQELPLGVCIMDMSANILWANSSYERITGYAWTKIADAGERTKRLYPDQATRRNLHEKWLTDISTPGHVVRELRARVADGSVKNLEFRLNTLPDEHILMTVVDVTEKRQQVESLSHMAHTDSLTGIHNRRFFLSRASAEVDRAIRFHRPLAVLMLDVDHFKRVNDTYGHLAGDEILRSIARSCEENLREHDIFGRIGGEEFAAVLVEADLEMALHSAERVRATLEYISVSHNGQRVGATASIGVATITSVHDSLPDLLARADKALYAAKAAGRNCIRPYIEEMGPAKAAPLIQHPRA